MPVGISLTGLTPPHLCACPRTCISNFIYQNKERLNNDGQQFHQYQQFFLKQGKIKQWWSTIPPISTKQGKIKQWWSQEFSICYWCIWIEITFFLTWLKMWLFFKDELKYRQNKVFISLVYHRCKSLTL
jgi:hypothetical protein